jgi:hypothetical protein
VDGDFTDVELEPCDGGDDDCVGIGVECAGDTCSIATDVNDFEVTVDD